MTTTNDMIIAEQEAVENFLDWLCNIERISASEKYNLLSRYWGKPIETPQQIRDRQDHEAENRGRE